MREALRRSMPAMCAIAPPVRRATTTAPPSSQRPRPRAGELAALSGSARSVECSRLTPKTMAAATPSCMRKVCVRAGAGVLRWDVQCSGLCSSSRSRHGEQGQAVCPASQPAPALTSCATSCGGTASVSKRDRSATMPRDCEKAIGGQQAVNRQSAGGWVRARRSGRWVACAVGDGCWSPPAVQRGCRPAACSLAVSFWLLDAGAASRSLQGAATLRLPRSPTRPARSLPPLRAPQHAAPASGVRAAASCSPTRGSAPAWRAGGAPGAGERGAASRVWGQQRQRRRQRRRRGAARGACDQGPAS